MTKEELHNKIQAAGFEMSAIRGQYNVLLNEDIIPLLSDAIDALELYNEYENPKLLSVALRRIKRAMKAAELKVFK